MELKGDSVGSGTLDILVALSIASVVVTASVPLSRSILLSSRLHSEARVLAQNIDAFATIAKLRDQALVVALTPEFFQVHTGTLGGEVVGYHRFAPGISATVPAAQQVTVYPSGALSPTTVELRAQRALCKVVVALRGRTTVVCQGD